jgi:hypothetical protein
MVEPLVVHCQCRPGCAGWIRIEDEDRDLIGTPGTRLVLPGHADGSDRIREVHPGYLWVSSRPPV